MEGEKGDIKACGKEILHILPAKVCLCTNEPSGYTVCKENSELGFPTRYFSICIAFLSAKSDIPAYFFRSSLERHLLNNKLSEKEVKNLIYGLIRVKDQPILVLLLQEIC